jgi:cell division protein YceG involved in septum cleavage
MSDSETFGVEKGHGEEVVAWLNENAKSQKIKLEARLYGYTIATTNFGDYEMFSWIGDVQVARKMIIKASKRFKVKVIEGGYKPKEKVLSMKKFDFAKVKRGDKTIGQLKFSASRFGNSQWEIEDEERH